MSSLTKFSFWRNSRIVFKKIYPVWEKRSLLTQTVVSESNRSIIDDTEIENLSAWRSVLTSYQDWTPSKSALEIPLEKTEKKIPSIDLRYYDFSKFIDGDWVLLQKVTRNHKKGLERVKLFGPLCRGKLIQTTYGAIQHDLILGLKCGSVVKTHVGIEYLAHFPTLDEYLMYARRHVAPIYPKDAATIVSLLDIRPTSHMLECGTGNGFLSMCLARIVFPMGHLRSIDENPQTIQKARRIIKNFSRGLYLDSISFTTGDVSAIFNKDPPSSPIYDGAVMDVPAPENHLASILPWIHYDRFIVIYLPNITQVLEVVGKIRVDKLALKVVQVLEVEWKPWDCRSSVIRKIDRKKNPANYQDPKDKPKEKSVLYTDFLDDYDDDDDDDDNHYEEEEDNSQGNISESRLPPSDVWVCRPSHHRGPHTGFLIQLRKNSY
ncbi:hypothetical protein G9A89_009207 [Geosiphon pyriformis]|nr:hypothetical protein G9A89_009207 [Geosiphon pyriformis]